MMTPTEAKDLVKLLPGKMVMIWPNGRHEVVSANANLNHPCWTYVNHKRGGTPKLIRAQLD